MNKVKVSHLLQQSIKHRENTKLATQLTPINKDTCIDFTLKHHKIGMKERYTTAFTPSC
jgi:hypothetical protein